MVYHLEKLPDIVRISYILYPLLYKWTQIQSWLICFALFYQLDLVLKLNFISDNIILIFSQSNVNITIDTKIHPITSLHISNQTK